MTATEAIDAEKKDPATLSEKERQELAAWQANATSQGFESVAEMEAARVAGAGEKSKKDKGKKA